MMNRYAAMIAGAALAMAVPALAQGTAGAKPAHYTTADTSIGTLLADPAAKAVIDKDIPGMSDNSSIGLVSSMTLRTLQPTAPDKLSDKTLDQVDADLSKIPAK